MAVTNGTGQGGKSFQDRELAAKVRTKTLEDIYEILTDSKKSKRFSAFKKQLLLKMSVSVLPRLNEHSGESGGPIQISLSKLLTQADE